MGLNKNARDHANWLKNVFELSNGLHANAMHSYACRNVEQIVTEYHESVIFCIVQNNYHSLECSVQSQPETKRQYIDLD